MREQSLGEGEALSPEAVGVLLVLLEGADPVRAALRAQIPHARVVKRCGCGCATVDLAVDRDAVVAAPPHESPVVSGTAHTVPNAAGVLVFSDGGYLSGLEIYSVADEPISEWPEARLLSVDAEG